MTIDRIFVIFSFPFILISWEIAVLHLLPAATLFWAEIGSVWDKILFRLS
jgi:hypothetical protein